MKHIVAMFFFVFAVGDCVELVKGVFKGEHWTIIEKNEDGTFDIKDHEYIIRDVRGSFMAPAEPEECVDQEVIE